ncbi:hypothetical protein CLOM_g17310 [Closterium sp. NIES-68]|nr:hypothetical protein CLOM_g784 [Closterium sp. NIES-68]GJP32709.1 hypothetical protein CLOM_g17310 [Closterium sp. NIES-68]
MPTSTDGAQGAPPQGPLAARVKTYTSVQKFKDKLKLRTAAGGGEASGSVLTPGGGSARPMTGGDQGNDCCPSRL